MNSSSRRDFLKSTVLGLTCNGVLAGNMANRAKADDTSKNVINEPARSLPVFAEADVCVLGGSCTGVFAAIRAARLGAKVILIEKQNSFGGTATNSMVNVWHSLMDTEFKQQIIAGLTVEVIERLKKRGAVKEERRSKSAGCSFNSDEMKIELDEMVKEAGVKPYLHTFFSMPYVKDGELKAVIVENKSGRGAIKAKMFIDATGDGDLCYRLGLKTYTSEYLQPPTTCARFSGWDSVGGKFNKLFREHGEEYDVPLGFVWGRGVPGSDVYMLAGTRVYGVDCSDAEQLTKAEIEGRRQVRSFMDMIRKYVPDNEIALQALPSQIGIRETRHVKCQYQIKGEDVLYAKRFDDAIANGSYRVDIHHQEKAGITFKYLDGTQSYDRPGYPSVKGRWRKETKTNPTFYQIPFRSLLPGKYGNLILAGRMLDADLVAFSAIRVMVNMNQTGEAAGTAAYLALESNSPITKLAVGKIREVMARGGSVII
ncbi:MAG: FAD-dependent oxidoreductase [Phycisphaerae bacterium]|nr:FAD-dependent oxidoreductase [Phycisphaerae bacterium]NIP50467.1 FAD-dependent oxidoreductase [Phycisphaerae bacterium]NIS49595.1 FAD-dependent oxidoreductase [Phycisphaerae bacterium]NIU07353.1 FAD-dependent oxidoreductase [Phycisphaerae bacterium]NIU54922.1 FAD-dependent oxidoreductase [Phycisphaerae bacterium]